MGLMYDSSVREYMASKEMGVDTPYNPALSLDILAGWGPALATSRTPFSTGEAVIRQARILGSGRPYHPLALEPPVDLVQSWANKNGAFVPPSEEGQAWKKKVMKGRKFEAPEEVKAAVLEDAVLGRYEGPKYAEPNDTLAMVRSYVKRDGTWNVGAERAIEHKVKTLLRL